MVFFLSPDEKIYARFGGRTSESADHKQTLEGLRATMLSVLKEHRSEKKRFAPTKTGKPFYISEIQNRRRGRCTHCHQAKEAIYNKIDREGKWNHDLAFRYPPPDNLGLILDVKKSGIVEQVTPKSSAAQAGLKPGDKLQELNGVPIHSFGDAQFALDKAPVKGTIKATWLRQDKKFAAELQLPKAWRRTDITWRRSTYVLVPEVGLWGKNLSDAEKKTLGLSPKRLAFRQDEATRQARSAGIRVGDIILGINDEKLEMRASQFAPYIQRHYIKEEKVEVNLIRDGKPTKVTLVLQ